MCICGGVGEAAIAAVAGGFIVRRIMRKRPPQRPVCPKCGAPQARLMYNSTLCFDCYYEILDTMRYEKGCNDKQETGK